MSCHSFRPEFKIRVGYIMKIQAAASSSPTCETTEFLEQLSTEELRVLSEASDLINHPGISRIKDEGCPQ